MTDWVSGESPGMKTHALSKFPGPAFSIKLNFPSQVAEASLQNHFINSTGSVLQRSCDLIAILYSPSPIKNAPTHFCKIGKYISISPL